MRSITTLRILVSLAVCAGMSACWVNSEQIVDKLRLDGDSDSDTETETETETELGPLTITSLDPVFGVNSGGAEVTIIAGPLGDEVEVTFGGSPAEVVSQTGDQVVVKTPSVALEGPVDVAVRSGQRSERLTGAYYYWEDGAGQTGMIGSVSTVDLDRPNLSGAAFEQTASLMFIEPVDFDYSSFYGSTLDSCVRDYRRSGPSISIIQPGIDSIALTDGVTSYDALPDEDGEVFSVPSRERPFSGGKSLDLSQGAGDAGWLPMQIDGFVQLPDTGFRVTNPDLDGTFPTVSEGFDLRWTGGTPGDYVLVKMYRYEGDNAVDNISCLLRDDGVHRVDSSLFTSWWWTSEMHFFVGRAHLSTAKIPFNGANIEVVGVRWYAGLAWQD
ncbi:MAG: hypothetical protein ACI9MC_001660 [Kiritimatiellia bacterium]|jgi:hypothetical protein